MALDTSEEEQVEKIQSFFRDNGWFIAIALVAALGGNYGYRTWEDQKAAYAASASDAFTAFQDASRGNVVEDKAALIAQGEALQLDYADSEYALLAGLQLAKIHFDAGDLQAAEATLREISDTDNELLSPLVQLRLARALSAQDRAEEGLTILAKQIRWAGFTSAKNELEGDLLYQLGRLDEARQSYQLAENTAGEGLQPGLTMKVQDLTFAEADIPAASEPDGSDVSSEIESEAGDRSMEEAADVGSASEENGQ